MIKQEITDIRVIHQHVRKAGRLALSQQGGHPSSTSNGDESSFQPSRGKTNNVVSEQARHKPACTSTEKS